MAASILVLGDGRYRAAVAQALEGSIAARVVDCDPDLGDCVMYVRLEGARFEAFVFVGHDDPVTRGALAAVAERAVLVPLLDPRLREPALPHHAYLFRLPRALGLRDWEEEAVIALHFPGAANVPREMLGASLDDAPAWGRLMAHATTGTWQWADLLERVGREPLIG